MTCLVSRLVAIKSLIITIIWSFSLFYMSGGILANFHEGVCSFKYIPYLFK